MSLLSQISVNFVFMIIKTLSQLLSVSIADLFLTAPVLGFALLLRRQGSLMGNGIQLGLSHSIRYFYVREADETKRKFLWYIQINWGLALAFVFIVLCILLPNTMSAAFLGSNGLLVSTGFGLCVAGISIGYLASTSWASGFNFVQFNIIDWCNGSLIFIACLLILDSSSFEYFIFVYGLCTLVTSSISLSYFIFKNKYVDKNFLTQWKFPKEVFFYSIPRGLSSFLDIATISLGPWLLRDNKEQAGQLILVYTFIRMSQVIIMPFSQVLSLRANSYLHDTKKEDKRVLVLSLISCGCGIFVVILYYLLGESLIKIWLPNSYSGVILILNELYYFIPATCLFYSLRNYIELKINLPVNLITFSVAISLLCIGGFINNSSTLDGVVFGSKLMFSTLFVSSCFYIGFIFKRIK